MNRTLEKTERENYQYCVNAITLKDTIERGFLGLAEHLYNIREEKLYQPAWTTWEEYCMEFKNLSYSSIMRLCQIHKTFVVDYKIAPARIVEAGGWSKMVEVMRVAKSKRDVDQWLDLAKNQSREHLRDSVNEIVKGISVDDCKHEDEYTLRICPTCGRKHKV